MSNKLTLPITLQFVIVGKTGKISALQLRSSPEPWPVTETIINVKTYFSPFLSLAWTPQNMAFPKDRENLTTTDFIFPSYAMDLPYKL